MKSLKNTMSDLAEVIAGRKDMSPDKSYVAKLFNKGRRKIAQKVGEEGVEVAMAAVMDDKKEIIAESADLLFHLLVLWEHASISPDEVADELRKREGVSGLDEKASRKK